MYRQSKFKRKYSSAPIVEVTIDGNGNEQETIICICTGKKAQADELAIKIIDLLNLNELTNFATQLFKKY